MRQASILGGVVLLFAGLGILVRAANANKSRLHLAQGLTVIELGIGLVRTAVMPSGIARTVIIWLGAVAVVSLLALQLKLLRQTGAQSDAH